MKRLVMCLLAVYSFSMCFAAQPPKGLLTAPLLAVDDIRATNLKRETAPDGTSYIAMRLHLDGVSAVRVYISDMQLAAGQKLLISNPSGTQVYGPFTIDGPTRTGEFWTDAVEGSDVIVELQTDSEGAGDLPFKIEAIEAAELSDIPMAAVEPSREVVESLYNGVPVTHEVVDGMALYEGDILLGPADQLPRAQATTKGRIRSAVGITGSTYRWPNGTMPYVIASDIPNATRITGAVDHWNSVMAGTVKMVPRTNESAYVSFVAAPSSGTCNSYIGKVFNGAHPIQVGSACSKGNVIHEIGHAWGLWHEHTREDRNRFVTVNYENVQSGQTHNFTQNISNGDDIGDYDYGSIMHYAKTSFSANGLPTIVPIPAGIAIGQRTALSTGDIAGIKALYPSISLAAVVPPPAVVVVAPMVTRTITANPVGADVSVDGVIYTSPATFNWPQNSVHTIAAVTPDDNPVKRTFVKWSDEGAQSHTITASGTLTTYKVDYATSYSIKAVPVPIGTAEISPPSPDGFYASGKLLTLTATAPTGYCFAGWTGLISGTPYITKLLATRAYDLEANFEPGATTLAPMDLAIPAAQGTYTVGVTTNSGCVWNATPVVSWITVLELSATTGSGTASVIVDANTTGLSRVGYIRIAGKMVKFTQAGI